MSAAKDRIQSVIRHRQQRLERQQIAQAAWRKAISRCVAIAEELLAHLDGWPVDVRQNGERVEIAGASGARAVFEFDHKQLSMVGRRTRPGEVSNATGDVFFSLRIEPPQRTVNNSTWGPSPEGFQAIAPTANSQEAYEKALADWLEWASEGDGSQPVT